MFNRTIYGKEWEAPRPLNLVWVSKGLRKYLEEDPYGVYKKEGIKIPFIYKCEYYFFKRSRENMINLTFEELENISLSDKIRKEMLLKMG